MSKTNKKSKIILAGTAAAVLAGVVGYQICTGRGIVRRFRKDSARRNSARLGLELKEVPYIFRGRDLHLKIMVPAGKGPYPVILFVQGSGWRKQNTDTGVINLSPLAQMGFVVAVVEYRYTDEGGYFPAQVEDTKTAVRFMKKYAQEYKGDAANVFLMGDSSGGHTALLAAMTAGTGEFDTQDYGEWDCSVRAVADFYGVTDPTDPQGFPQASGGCGSPASNEGRLFGGKRIADVMDYASRSVVMNYVNGEIPPVFIQHGDADHIVVYSQSVRLHAALTSAGKEHSFEIIKSASHGDRMFYTKENLEKVAAYFRKYVRTEE